MPFSINIKTFKVIFEGREVKPPCRLLVYLKNIGNGNLGKDTILLLLECSEGHYKVMKTMIQAGPRMQEKKTKVPLGQR